ncbi:helix-turn-helix domain-containing protein [Hoeflea sp. TYP-13]|uniref:helix-turn-helix domain-containing protein n=1 Tax=Hoeflea sp. TYP-13 TaxID=3230023 RepID=UPI0034C63AA7
MTKKKLDHLVRPGGLTDADHERIHELAERGWASTRIAREIEKHPSTVLWFMYRSGLRAPKDKGLKPYCRGGKMVYHYPPEEDEFITALRIANASLIEIARKCTERFGWPRSPHSVQNRLTMLAAREV